MKFGGTDGANALAQSPGISLLPKGGARPLALLETWSIPEFGSVLASELVGRVIATRSAEVARRTPVMAAGMYVAAGVIPITIGLLAVGIDVTVSDTEQVVPMVARELRPTLVYAIFVGAFISAITARHAMEVGSARSPRPNPQGRERSKASLMTGAKS